MRIVMRMEGEIRWKDGCLGCLGDQGGLGGQGSQGGQGGQGHILTDSRSLKFACSILLSQQYRQKKGCCSKCEEISPIDGSQ